MLTEKDYCDYDTCVALKEIGYNEKSNWWFSKFFNEDSGQMELVYISNNPAHLNYDSWGVVPQDFIIRPSLYEAQKWLREEKHIEILVLSKGMVGAPYDVQVYTEDYSISDDKEYSYYEDALSEGLRKAVEILKE